MEHTTPASKNFGHWLGYSTLATALLALNQKAEAQAVYVDIDPDAVLVNETLDIDFDSDGITDISIVHLPYSYGTGLFYGDAFLPLPEDTKVKGDNSPYVNADVLPIGAVLAPNDTTFRHTYVGNLISIVTIDGEGPYFVRGNWLGQTGYVGLSFTAGDGLTHYGWVELTVPESVFQVSVKAYGYQSMPDSAITAGEKALIPTSVNANTADILSMQASPNPVTTAVRIELADGMGTAQVQLLNAMGEVLKTSEFNTAEGLTLDLSGVAPGAYFLRAEGNGKVAFRKLIKL
ncbi:MAG: T9SS type A sorting domain-containing protein [Flavobacteriales bacterium]